MIEYILLISVVLNLILIGESFFNRKKTTLNNLVDTLPSNLDRNYIRPPVRLTWKPYFTSEIYFTPEECDKIISVGRKKGIEPGRIGEENAYVEDIRIANHSFIYMKDYPEFFDKLIKAMLKANKEIWNFDLSAVCDPFDLVHYPKGGFFASHTDNSDNPTTALRKLSASIQLSEEDDYTGGDVIFYQRQYETAIPRKRGSINIFPAFMIHMVTPVTSGNRWSLVGSLEGPMLR